MNQVTAKDRFNKLRLELFPEEKALVYKQNKKDLYDENDKPQTLFMCTCSDDRHTIKQYARKFTCPNCNRTWILSKDTVMHITSKNPSHIEHYNIPNNIKTVVETKQTDDYIKLQINTVINQFKIMTENNKQAKFRLFKEGKNININDPYMFVDDRHALSIFRYITIKTITLLYNVKSKILYKYVYDTTTKKQRIINTSYIDFDNNKEFWDQIESQTKNSKAVIGKINNEITEEIQTNNEIDIKNAIKSMYKPWVKAISDVTGEPLSTLSDVSALLACSKLKTLRRMIGRNKTPNEYLKTLQLYDETKNDLFYFSMTDGTFVSNIPSNLLKKMRKLDSSNEQLNLRDMTKCLFPGASKNETKIIHTLYESMSNNKNVPINILIIHFIYYAHMYMDDPHKRNNFYQTMISNINNLDNDNIDRVIELTTSISKLAITNKTKTRLYELLLSIAINYTHNYEPISYMNDIINSIKSITQILSLVKPIITRKNIKSEIEEYITPIETNNVQLFDNKINSMVFLINNKYPRLEEYVKEYYGDFNFNYDHIDQSLFTKELGRFNLYLPESSYDLRKIGQLLSICVGNGYYADAVKNKTSLIAILQDKFSTKLTCLEVFIDKNKNKKPKYILVQAKGPYNNQNFPLPGDVIHTIIDFCEQNKIRIECHHDLKRPLKLKRVI